MQSTTIRDSSDAGCHETLKQPLGLGPAVAYFTNPREAKGTSNPLVAGGMRASMDDYAKLLALVYRNGTTISGSAIVAPQLIAAQSVEPFPAATIGSSPMAEAGQPFRYGLTAWLECATPATGCATISSPGAFGFTPWLDRETGYYAILGMQLEAAPAGEETASAFSVAIAQQLKPVIATVLAAH